MAKFPILKDLQDRRIFSISQTVDGDFVISEECDNYFEVQLTKHQMMALVVEIASYIKAGGDNG